MTGPAAEPGALDQRDALPQLRHDRRRPRDRWFASKARRGIAALALALPGESASGCDSLTAERVVAAWHGKERRTRPASEGQLIAQSAARAAVIDQRAVPMHERDPVRRVAPRLVG